MDDRAADPTEPDAPGFLAAHHPFDQLSADALAQVAQDLEARSVAAGEQVLTPDQPVTHLHIVRRGAVEVRDRDGLLLARLGEGDVFGQYAMAEGAAADISAVALDEALLYLIPAERFEALCASHPPLRYFLAPRGGLGAAAGRRRPGAAESGSNLLHTPVGRLVAREPVTITADTSVRAAAQTMGRQGISSLLVLDAQGALVGIVTDRDLRTRVLAAGRSPEAPVGEVMSPSPATIEASGHAYEALLIMARSHYHHLPVMDDGRLVGMLTDTDLLQRHSTSPLFMVGDVHRCNTVEDLAAATTNLRKLLVTLVDANASCYSVGRVISSVGEAVNSRLLVLAEERFGPPPVPYAWMTGGSLARLEQTALSDQDNCLLLADEYDETAHGEYFRDLADFVCDALNDCGYVYCPGEIMAKTPRWRQPLAQWKRYFDGWIDAPQPKALMHACIFFDLRRLHGDAPLFGALHEYVLRRAQENRIFHAYMASNAITHQPPLGFFGNFVLVKDGEHDRTLDLKHNGVVPIVDIARIYALVAGVPRVNTTRRLEAAATRGALSGDGAADLRDALEFIGTVRLRHQANQIANGEAPDNFVHPERLSSFERSHLKDAFAVVRTHQQALSQRYQAGRL
jgi:CBS domain-containing protein